MRKLTIEVSETPRFLAYRCRVEAELNDMTSCPFRGAVCPLGIVNCREVKAADWEAVLSEEEEDDGQED